MPLVEKMDKASELERTIKALSINTDLPKVVASRPSFTEDSSVAESWEDEATDEATDHVPHNISRGYGVLSPASGDIPYVPPPTPISPSAFKEREQYPSSLGAEPERPVRGGTTARDPDKRPEKSTAVANRLIAGALGVRAPKRTEEQRKYDRAIKEQEIRRKNKEKEDEKRKLEEAEKAKAAIWED